MKKRLTRALQYLTFENANQCMNTATVSLLELKIGVITRREAEILYLLSEGLSCKEIAAKLNISVHTAQKHTKNCYRKLNVHNRIEAINKTKWLIASLYRNQN